MHWPSLRSGIFIQAPTRILLGKITYLCRSTLDRLALSNIQGVSNKLPPNLALAMRCHIRPPDTIACYFMLGIFASPSAVGHN